MLGNTEYRSIGFCPSCGSPLEKYGRSFYSVVSVGNGMMRLKLDYDYCPHCGLDLDLINRFVANTENNLQKVFVGLWEG